MDLENQIEEQSNFLTKTKDFISKGPNNPYARVGVATTIIYPVTAMVHNMIDSQLNPYSEYFFNLDTVKYASIPIGLYALYKLVQSSFENKEK